MSYAQLDSDYSYKPNMPSLAEDGAAIEMASVARPNKTLALNLPSQLRLPPPSELTPPPSPPARGMTFDALNSATKMLNRASSAITRRQSVSPQRSEASGSRRASPSRASRVSNAAAAFADLFQGSSELVNSFSVSSKKQYEAYMQRPAKSRSAKAARELAASPEDDEILNVDIDSELFAGWSEADDSIAVDDIVGNAQRLFLRMQIAYESKLEALGHEMARRQQLQEDLEVERTRSEHMKRQLKEFSEDLEEEQRANDKMKRQLDCERSRRKQTIRHVQAPVRESMYGLTAAHDEDESDDSDYWSGPATPLSAKAPTTSGEYALGYGFLRQENHILKARVAELEETVDSCLMVLPVGLNR